MSGAGHQRTFDTLNKTIVNASDYIQRKRDSTRWKALNNNIKRESTINPRKKNGYYYQDNYFATTYSNDSSGCVVAAKSYDLLHSISRGKYFTNPILDGLTAAGPGMWTGNLLEIKYQSGCGSESCGNYSAPIRLTNLYNSTASESPYWAGGSGYDFMPFPDAELNDACYNGLVPGFIIDPSNSIFYNKCIGPSRIPFKNAYLNKANIKFKNTKYYWKGVNAQPLEGYKFPQRIPLYYQGPDPNGKFLPIVPTPPGVNIGDESYSEVLLEDWCKGLYAIH